MSSFLHYQLNQLNLVDFQEDIIAAKKAAEVAKQKLREEDTTAAKEKEREEDILAAREKHKEKYINFAKQKAKEENITVAKEKAKGWNTNDVKEGNKGLLSTKEIAVVAGKEKSKDEATVVADKEAVKVTEEKAKKCREKHFATKVEDFDFETVEIVLEHDMKLLPGLGLFDKARDSVTGEGEGGHIKPPKTLPTAGDFLDANKDQSAIEHMQEAQEAAGHKDQSAVEHMHEAAGHKDQSADKKEGEDDDSDAKKGDDKKNKNLKVDLANRNEHSILKDESVSANFKNTTADESPFNAFTKGEARSLFNKLSGKMKNHLNNKITELDEATHIKFGTHLFKFGIHLLKFGIHLFEYWIHLLEYWTHLFKFGHTFEQLYQKFKLKNYS